VILALLVATGPAAGARSHRIVGSRHADHLVGTRGADVIRGRRGHDTIVGRKGSDRLRGGRGQDRIFARDGVRDLVVGGPGTDICVADRLDEVRGCEVVDRPGAIDPTGPRVIEEPPTSANQSEASKRTEVASTAHS